MNNKPFIPILVAFLVLCLSSVILHEWIHVFQIHYVYGIPYSDITMHTILEIDDFSQFTIFTLPLAWVSFPGCAGTNTLMFEVQAYSIQFLYIIIVYLKILEPNMILKSKGL